MNGLTRREALKALFTGAGAAVTATAQASSPGFLAGLLDRLRWPAMVVGYPSGTNRYVPAGSEASRLVIGYTREPWNWSGPHREYQRIIKEHPDANPEVLPQDDPGPVVRDVLPLPGVEDLGEEAVVCAEPCPWPV